MNVGTPPAEHDIDERLVRRLLHDQHADLADRDIALLDEGWDNANYRIGKTDVARLPRRQLAATLIKNEQQWLPSIAKSLPIAAPIPKRIGRPTAYYPWSWSIVPWIPGETADIEPPDANQAPVLAEFLLALHQPAPPTAPSNSVRGTPLRHRTPNFEKRLDRLRNRSHSVTSDLLQIWEQALTAPEATESRWLHGDLHARNVLVSEGTITGVIDWGDITSGDVATDLSSIWMLFDTSQARAVCLAKYGASPTQILRAKGWAMSIGIALLDSGLVDHPRHAAMGEAVLRRLREDA